MSIKEKFKEADKNSISTNEMASKCEDIADEYLLDFVTWLHSGQTFALDKADLLKIFKEDYKKNDRHI